MHYVIVKDGYYIKSTNGCIINEPLNPNIDLGVIQMNHYKTKTLEEYLHIRQRRFAVSDVIVANESIINNFNGHNINEMEDLTAYNYYKNYLN